MAPKPHAVALLCFFVAGVGQAQVSTHYRASIIAFPRIVADDGTDTIITLSNTSNNVRHVDCYYVSTGSGSSVGARFHLSLAKLQPTHWSVHRGRTLDPTDPTCRTTTDCDGAGLDAGLIPPAGDTFAGFVTCIEVDASDFPVPGNALNGQATVIDGTGRVSKYNGIGIRGFDTNNMDARLCIGGEVRTSCPSGAEYVACPKTWFLQNTAEASTDPVTDGTWMEHTIISVMPCGYDLIAGHFPTLQLELSVENDLAQRFSTSTTVEGGGDIALSSLGDVFRSPMAGSGILSTTVRSAADSPPFILVGSTKVDQSAGESVPVAFNVHTDSNEGLGVVLQFGFPEQVQQ